MGDGNDDVLRNGGASRSRGTMITAVGVGGRVVAEGVGLLAAALARADGATCRTVDVPGAPGARDGETVRVRVCSGARGRTFARGGTTYGTTYVTGSHPRTCADDRLRHEAAHVLQWRRWGLLLPLLYGLAELRAGGDPTRNRFEAAAGLRDGGYR